MSLERAPAALTLLSRHAVPRAVRARRRRRRLPSGRRRAARPAAGPRRRATSTPSWSATAAPSASGWRRRSARGWCRSAARSSPPTAWPAATSPSTSGTARARRWPATWRGATSPSTRFAFDLAAERLVDPHDGLRDLERAPAARHHSGELHRRSAARPAPAAAARPAPGLRRRSGDRGAGPRGRAGRRRGRRRAGARGARAALREPRGPPRARPPAVDRASIRGSGSDGPGETREGSGAGAAVDEMERLAGAALAVRAARSGLGRRSGPARRRAGRSPSSHLPGRRPRDALRAFAAAGPPGAAPRRAGGEPSRLASRRPARPRSGASSTPRPSCGPPPRSTSGRAPPAAAACGLAAVARGGGRAPRAHRRRAPRSPGPGQRRGGAARARDRAGAGGRPRPGAHPRRAGRRPGGNTGGGARAAESACYDRRFNARAGWWRPSSPSRGKRGRGSQRVIQSIAPETDSRLVLSRATMSEACRMPEYTIRALEAAGHFISRWFSSLMRSISLSIFSCASWRSRR